MVIFGRTVRVSALEAVSSFRVVVVVVIVVVVVKSNQIKSNVFLLDK